MKNDVVKNELVKKVNTIQTNYNSDLVKKKLTTTQKLKILKRKFLLMTIILILMNLISK